VASVIVWRMHRVGIPRGRIPSWAGLWASGGGRLLHTMQDVHVLANASHQVNVCCFARFNAEQLGWSLRDAGVGQDDLAHIGPRDGTELVNCLREEKLFLGCEGI